MTLRIETRDAIRILTLDRPAVRNAVDPALAQALFDAARAAEADAEVGAVILTGAGGHFCAGFDLRAVAEAGDWIAACAIPPGWADPAAMPLPSPMGPARLWMTKPVIAAVEGHAVAGGLELALWADLRVAAAGAIFGVFCRRWGVPLIDGGTLRLPAVVGAGRAADLILTGRPVDAAEALAAGLANRVVPEGAALDGALDLARQLMRLPQAALRADLLSARMPPAELAARLAREWDSCAALAEGAAGAARFVAGAGRGGATDDGG